MDTAADAGARLHRPTSETPDSGFSTDVPSERPRRQPRESGQGDATMPPQVPQRPEARSAPWMACVLLIQGADSVKARRPCAGTTGSGHGLGWRAALPQRASRRYTPPSTGTTPPFFSPFAGQEAHGARLVSARRRGTPVTFARRRGTPDFRAAAGNATFFASGAS